jgi:ribosome maturation factor RimP
MAKADTVRTMVEPLAAEVGADVYDVTFTGGKLVVALSRRDGIDLDTLSDISRELGVRLDEDDVIGGSYTLEVTSPGLERPLRTPDHYRGAVGESVTIRTNPDVEGERRVRGTIASASDDAVTVALTDDDDTPTGESRTVAYTEIERARTTFSWGPAPKPGGPKKPGTKKSGKNKEARS